MNSIEGWVKESKASINENPNVRKALDEISAGLSKIWRCH